MNDSGPKPDRRSDACTCNSRNPRPTSTSTFNFAPAAPVTARQAIMTPCNFHQLPMWRPTASAWRQACANPTPMPEQGAKRNACPMRTGDDPSGLGRSRRDSSHRHAGFAPSPLLRTKKIMNEILARHTGQASGASREGHPNRANFNDGKWSARLRPGRSNVLERLPVATAIRRPPRH